MMTEKIDKEDLMKGCLARVARHYLSEGFTFEQLELAFLEALEAEETMRNGHRNCNYNPNSDNGNDMVYKTDAQV